MLSNLFSTNVIFLFCFFSFSRKIDRNAARRANSGRGAVNPAGGAATLSAAAAEIPRTVLQGGEEIILAVRPSLWFIFLRSLPGGAILVVIVAALWIVERFGRGLPVATGAVLLALGLFFAILVFIRAAIQWTGRLYVLTNRRLLTFRGGFTPDVYECPLARVSDVVVVHYGCERVLGVGSAAFTIEANPYARPGWIHIRRIDDVVDEVRRAVARARE
jgi:hypothetical protein